MCVKWRKKSVVREGLEESVWKGWCGCKDGGRRGRQYGEEMDGGGGRWMQLPRQGAGRLRWRRAREPRRSPAMHVNVTSLHVRSPRPEHERAQAEQEAPRTVMKSRETPIQMDPASIPQLPFEDLTRALIYWSNITWVCFLPRVPATRSQSTRPTQLLYFPCVFFFFASHVFFYYKLKKRIQYNKKLQ